MITKNLIICKYREDIQWLNNLKYDYNIHLYDKSRFVENVGREAETYFQFIINYYNLIRKDDIYIFTQADPFYHDNNFIQIIHNINDIHFFGERYECDINGFPQHPNLNLNEFISECLQNQVNLNISDKIIFYAGAIFAVKGTDLLKYNLSFYNKIYEYIISRDYSPWQIERFFYLLYNR
jgi:hypothetical protein